MSDRNTGPLLSAALDVLRGKVRYLLAGGRYPWLLDLLRYVPALSHLPEFRRQSQVAIIVHDLTAALADVTAEDMAKPHVRELVEADLRHALNRLQPFIAPRREAVA